LGIPSAELILPWASFAMFSDDTLFEKFVLKGGNALNLVYKFGSRVSIDIDLSLDADFGDIGDTTERILRALRDRFAESGHVVFDGKLEARPPLGADMVADRWGGYEVSFKLIVPHLYGYQRCGFIFSACVCRIGFCFVAQERSGVGERASGPIGCPLARAAAKKEGSFANEIRDVRRAAALRVTSKSASDLRPACANE
jgi:hypothetical protein